MLQKTRGIVMHQIKYGDTSAVVKIYTEEYGMLGFLVKGLHRKKSGIRSNLFGNLSMLEMVISYHPNKNLHHIREASLSYNFSGIPQDIRKSTILLFLNEVLYKCIQEEEPNKKLFAFIHNSIIWLDEQQEHFGSFHIHFLIKLTKYLGFYPAADYSEADPVFDMEEGHFTSLPPLHDHTLEPPLSTYLFRLMGTEPDGLSGIRLNRNEKRQLLDKILLFYRIHLPELREIKSHTVLQTILD